MPDLRSVSQALQAETSPNFNNSAYDQHGNQECADFEVSSTGYSA